MTDDYQNDLFGTDAYKLHRREGPETSKDAAHSVDTTRLEKIVYDVIAGYPNGCIQDDVLRDLKHHDFAYSSITARFSALLEKKLIVRTGEKRVGRSGRGQMVMKKDIEE